MSETLNTVLWVITRAAGLTSVVLLTAVVVLGALVAVRRRHPGPRQAVIMGVHRSLSLLATVFVLLHIVTAVVETYVDISWISVLVPFTSGYASFAVGLGTIAFDLLLAVIITGLLRHRLPVRVFRAVHWLAYGLWPIALLHGVLATSTDGLLVTVVTVVCAAVGAAAVVWRSLQIDEDGRARTAGEVGAGSGADPTPVLAGSRGGRWR